jgi:hypothetical protein
MKGERFALAAVASIRLPAAGSADLLRHGGG